MNYHRDFSEYYTSFIIKKNTRDQFCMVCHSHQRSSLFIGSYHLGIPGLGTTGQEDRSRLLSLLPCQADSMASSPCSLVVMTLGSPAQCLFSGNARSCSSSAGHTLSPGPEMQDFCPLVLLETALGSAPSIPDYRGLQGDGKAHGEVSSSWRRGSSATSDHQLLLSVSCSCPSATPSISYQRKGESKA